MVAENLTIISIGCGTGVVEQYLMDCGITTILVHAEDEQYDVGPAIQQHIGRLRTRVKAPSQYISLTKAEALPSKENIERFITYRIWPKCEDPEKTIFMFNFPPKECSWEAGEKKSIADLSNKQLGLAHYVNFAATAGAKIFYYGQDFGGLDLIAPLTPTPLQQQYYQHRSFVKSFALPIPNTKRFNDVQKQLLRYATNEITCLGFGFNRDKQSNLYVMKLCANPKCSSTRKELQFNALKRCKACQAVCYCSRECQKKHWQSSHKAHCQAIGSNARDG